jgi:predicted short-subunit dehydrogenase-like oxidoreductase (DUF2520 family)
LLFKIGLVGFFGIRPLIGDRLSLTYHPCMAKSPDVAIVGLGNWGSSLAHACVEKNIALREVVVRSRRPRGSQLPIVGFEEAAFDARVIWLCVRDGEIAEVARRIVLQRGHMKGQILLHSSGALSVKELAVAKRAGAQVASLAPVMSFPTRTTVSLQGVLFAVEAEASTRPQLHALVRRLGGKPFVVASRKKPLYHAAATMASPLLVSELSAAMAMAQLAGLSPQEAKRWLEALAQATLNNVFSRGAEKSFSGAFARGDTATIHLHLQALAAHPILAGIYHSLARYAVESLPVQKRKELQALLTKDPSA